MYGHRPTYSASDLSLASSGSTLRCAVRTTFSRHSLRSLLSQRRQQGRELWRGPGIKHAGQGVDTCKQPSQTCAFGRINDHLVVWHRPVERCDCSRIQWLSKGQFKAKTPDSRHPFVLLSAASFLSVSFTKVGEGNIRRAPPAPQY